MKSIVSISLFTIVFHIPLLAVSDAVEFDSGFSIAENIECEYALVLNCTDQSSVYSNFSQGGVATLSSSSCLSANPELDLREFWFKVNFTSSVIYFIDGNGVNLGLEVYTGTCKNLTLVSCHSASLNNTYLSFYYPTDSVYYVRALGYDYNGGSSFQMLLHCFSPEPPTCTLTIDHIAVAPCTDSLGNIEIEIGGSAIGNESLDFVGCEIQTDENLYFFDGVREDSTWTLQCEIQGSEIEYIYAFFGSSANLCTDAIDNSIELPTTMCSAGETGNLMGTIIWNASCAPRLGKVSFYQPGTANLLARYDVLVGSNGHFEIDDPITGLFDILVKVDGYLAKGFTDVEVSDVEFNLLECGLLRGGDVSNDNFVSLVDLSIINTWFNQTMPYNSPFKYIDLNCDGIVNIAELSIINYSYGMEGDTVPLD